MSWGCRAFLSSSSAASSISACLCSSAAASAAASSSSPSSSCKTLQAASASPDSYVFIKSAQGMMSQLLTLTAPSSALCRPYLERMPPLSDTRTISTLLHCSRAEQLIACRRFGMRSDCIKFSRKCGSPLSHPRSRPHRLHPLPRTPLRRRCRRPACRRPWRPLRLARS